MIAESQMRRAPTLVIIVQRHRVLRDAVRHWLESEVDIEIVAAVANVAQAVATLIDVPESVVVIDEPQSGGSPFAIVNELRAASSEVRIVMLVGSPDIGSVSGAINAGVSSVLCSDAPSAALAQAVRTVAFGVCVIDEVALRQLAGAWQTSAHPALSARERQVLARMAAGSSNIEIAGHLYVSSETVKTHVANVLRKLDVPNRTSAVERATQLGLLS